MIREKRKFQNQPIGVVRGTEASASADTWKAIANVSSSIAGEVYKLGVEDAKQRGISEAEQIKLPALNDEGYFENVSLPNAGSVRTKAFEETLKFRMEKDIDIKMRTALASLQSDPELKDNPDLFAQKASTFIEAVVNNASPEFKTYAQQIGENYQASSLIKVQSNFYKKEADKQVLFFQETALRSANLIEQLVQSNQLDDALQVIEQNSKAIDNAPHLTVPHKREYKSYMRIALMQGLIANHTQGFNKQQYAKFKNDFFTNRENLPPIFKDVIDPHTGIGVDIQDTTAIKQYINSLASLMPDGTAHVISAYGNSPKNQEKIESFLDNNIEPTTGQSGEVLVGSMNWKNPAWRQAVSSTGAMPTNMTRLMKSYADGNYVDRTGETGYDLLQMYNHMRTDINVAGKTFAEFDKGFFPKDFATKMSAVNLYMDLEDSPEMFGKVWGYLHQQGGINYQDLGKHVNLDDSKVITRKDINAVVKQKMIESGTSFGMTTTMADRFVDEAILLMQISRSGEANREPMSLDDAISLVSNRMKEIYKHDDTVTSSGQRFISELHYGSGNLQDISVGDEGPIMVDMGNKVVNMDLVNTTMFALETTLQPNHYPDSVNQFKKYVTNLAKVNGADEGSVAGDGVLLEVDENSSLHNTRYLVMARQDGEMLPVMINNQTPLIVTTRDFLNTRYRNIKSSYIFEGAKQEAIEEKQYQDKAKGMVGTAITHLFGGKAVENGILGNLISEYLPDMPRIERSNEDSYLKQFETTSIHLPTVMSEEFYTQAWKEEVGEYDVDIFQKYGIKNMRPSYTGYDSIERGNPLNIRLDDKNKWVGKLKGNNKNFETFETEEHGYRAGLTIMNTYQNEYFKEPMTIKDMISRWAPEKGKDNEGKAYTNPTGNYIKFVEQITGYPSSQV